MGVGALWREGILVQTVLAGETKSWKRHPQIDRFREHPEPMEAIGFYLIKVREEAILRGYSYDGSKIRHPVESVTSIPVATGQLAFEFSLLLERTYARSLQWYDRIKGVDGLPEPHPIFRVVEGR
jgi:hypothetical protein